MRKYILAAAVVAVVLPLSPALARVMTGYTVRPTEILSGPDGDYPTVRDLGPDSRLTVYGCLNDWSWCDVSYRYDRGWIAGEDIAVTYQGRRRAITPYIGLGVLSFMFGTYWDNHYRGRPFYSDRPRWQQNYTQHYRPEWGGHRPAQNGPWQNGNQHPGVQNRQPYQGQGQPGQAAPYRGANPAPRPADTRPAETRHITPGAPAPQQHAPAMIQHQQAPITRTAPANRQGGPGQASGQQGQHADGQPARPQGGEQQQQRPQGRDNAERKSRD